MSESKTILAKKVVEGNIYLVLVLIGAVISTVILDKPLVVIYLILAFAFYFYKYKEIHKELYLKK